VGEAKRLIKRIENVLDHAWLLGLIANNPARGISIVIPKPPPTVHHKAMPYAQIPPFIAQLRSQKSIPRLAFEWLILTATRSSEGRGTRWEEFAGDLWNIPAERMKEGRPFTVPVTKRMREILHVLEEYRVGPLVFTPGSHKAKMIASQSLYELRPAGSDLHGFRSSFRDWVGNETDFPREVAQAALAHLVGDKSEQAYRRDDALAKRRKLMELWSEFCSSAPS
jgi:integrase